MRRALTLAVLIAALAGGTVRTFAQGDTDCLGTLSHAESEFAAGRFYGIPGMLTDCLDRNRFSNEEMVRVQMLLTQVYLLTDNPTAADEAYLKLLNANPEYVPTDLDPIEIVYLSKKFTSTPIFTPHIKGGVNISNASIIYAENVVSTPGATAVNHVALPGWTAGGGIEWNITDNIGLGVEGLVSQKRFSTQIAGLFGSDDGESIERQFWLDVPVYARYGWNKGTVRPFVYAGASINLLLSAKVDETFNNRTAGFGSEGEQLEPTGGAATDIMYKRNFLNRALVFGAGAKFKIGKDFLVVDARYMPGLSSVVNSDNSYYSSGDRNEINPSMPRYSQIGDIFRMTNFSVSFGYVRPIYNPRKARKVKTKSVSRQLIRDEGNEK